MIDGLASHWHHAGDVTLAREGTGTLRIMNDAAAQIDGVIDVQELDAVGTILLDNGTLTVGGIDPTLTQILGSGMINTRSLIVDASMVFDANTGGAQQVVLNSLPGQNIALNYDNAGPASVAFDTFLGAGQQGTGSIEIRDGVELQSALGYLGYYNGADGTLTIDGVGSRWNVDKTMLVGREGSGTVNILNGGVLETGAAVVAETETATGTVLIDGVGSAWQTDTISIGQNTSNRVTIANGGVLSSRSAWLSSGTVTVADSGSLWNNAENLSIGSTLLIRQGGEVRVGGATTVATDYFDGSSLGTIHFDDGTLVTKGLFARNDALQGTGDIYTDGLIADFDVSFDTPGSLAQQHTLDTLPEQNVTIHFDPTVTPGVTRDTFVGAGFAESGTLSVSNGVILQTTQGFLGYIVRSDGTATVTGPASQWITDEQLVVGGQGRGTLDILNGGEATNGSVTLATG